MLVTKSCLPRRQKASGSNKTLPAQHCNQLPKGVYECQQLGVCGNGIFLGARTVGCPTVRTGSSPSPQLAYPNAHQHKVPCAIRLTVVEKQGPPIFRSIHALNQPQALHLAMSTLRPSSLPVVIECLLPKYVSLFIVKCKIAALLSFFASQRVAMAPASKALTFAMTFSCVLSPPSPSKSYTCSNISSTAGRTEENVPGVTGFGVWVLIGERGWLC